MATKEGCTIVGIPVDNEEAIPDITLVKGIKPLYEIQIFSLETIEDARAIAYEDRNGDYFLAISEFEMVSKALRKNESFIHNKKLLEKLKEIVTLAPNHVSAKHLLLYGLKKEPKKLSLRGSINTLIALEKSSPACLIIKAS